MPSITRTFLGLAMLAVAHGQGVVLKAVGDSGTSLGLLGMLISITQKGTHILTVL